MKRNRIVIAIVIAALCALMAVPAASAATAKLARVKGVAAKAAGSTSVKVTWKAVAKAKGYKVRYSTKANMKGAKTVTVKGAKKRARVLKSLKGCTTYYVQVRAYKSKKVLGKWSARKAVKTAHVYKQVAAASATCTTAAHNAYKACKKCGYAVGKQVTAAALGHVNRGICSRCKELSYTWAQLKAIANEISACATEEAALGVAESYGLLASDGKLTGDEVKSVTLSNGAKCQAQILGFWHDTKTTGGKAGITFGFKGIAAEHEMNDSRTNSGGWAGSQMRSWLNSTFYKLLPSALKAQIAPASKMTNNAVTIKGASAVTATSDKLWLLGQTECFGTSYIDYVQTQWIDVEGCDIYAAMFAAEGTQYKLYADNEVTLDNCSLLVKRNASNQASYWWLRSPLTFESQRFFSVCDNGEWSTSNSPSSCGVSPAFCL